MANHKTRTVLVRVDVDKDIAGVVEYLNTIPGVRTLASCQGTIGEGGPHPYNAYVMCTWTGKALKRLRREFDVDVWANDWGYIHPRD